MTLVTYYIAQPYVRSDDGGLVAVEPVECHSANSARMMAVRLSETHIGAVAYSRTGDLSVGEFGPAKIIDRFGETPDKLT